MGYISIYRVFDSTGKSLGQCGGWTADEAIKRALRKHPGLTGMTAKYIGDNS